jgi:L-ascorbate metabolism protein UlaG (beta-lactamase superfamily)
VLRLGAFTVLTDPNFLHLGQRAYLGKGLWSRRLTQPAMQPDDLPALDAVVLSHLHGDHFDRIARKDLARSQPVLTTPAAARRLSRFGFTTHGLRTWERHTLTKGYETLTIEALPAVHARGLMGALLPPVMGSLLEHRVRGEDPHRVYLSGDTLTGDHVSAIAERHPEIDVAVVHLGGTRVLLHTVTMDAEQGVDFLRRARPAEAVPVHYDDYRVFRSPLSAFLEAAGDAGLAATVRTVGRGQTIPLGTRGMREHAWSSGGSGCVGQGVGRDIGLRRFRIP